MSDSFVPQSGTEQREPSLPEALMAVRKRKRTYKKAKTAAEEITYLNIVAMVDVLTILLIFLLKSVSVSSTAVSMSAEMQMPFSSTVQMPIDAVKIYITRDKIVVEDKVVADIAGGAVDAKKLSPGNTYLIPALEDALTNWIKWEIVFKRHSATALNMQILADKDTPYHILMQVLYSAGRAGAEHGGKAISFSKYRLLVMRAAS